MASIEQQVRALAEEQVAQLQCDQFNGYIERQATEAEPQPVGLRPRRPAPGSHAVQTRID
jgi:hypothetical protein